MGTFIPTNPDWFTSVLDPTVELGFSVAYLSPDRSTQTQGISRILSSRIVTRSIKPIEEAAKAPPPSLAWKCGHTSKKKRSFSSAGFSSSCRRNFQFVLCSHRLLGPSRTFRSAAKWWCTTGALPHQVHSQSSSLLLKKRVCRSENVHRSFACACTAGVEDAHARSLVSLFFTLAVSSVGFSCFGRVARHVFSLWWLCLLPGTRLISGTATPLLQYLRQQRCFFATRGDDATSMDVGDILSPALACTISAAPACG